MIRLDREIVLNGQKPQNDTSSQSNELVLYAQEILKKMKSENIAPTPYNFQIYFETMLDDADDDFKKKVESLRQNEANINDEEKHIQIEKDIKDSFIVVKSMILSISSVYKNISMIKSFIKKRAQELSSTQNNLANINILSSLENDMNKFDAIISNQLQSLKLNYEKAIDSLKSVESQAIYDTRYDIYNKKYLIQTIKNEQKSISKQNHKSTIMALRVKKIILAKIKSNRDRIALTKNIAKLLQKTSKRSDIVAHFEEGIFMILMKHTNLDAAKLACQRVANLIYSSSFFIGEVDLDMNIEIAITNISDENSAEEILTQLLQALPKSSKEGENFITVQN